MIRSSKQTAAPSHRLGQQSVLFYRQLRWFLGEKQMIRTFIHNLFYSKVMHTAALKDQIQTSSGSIHLALAMITVGLFAVMGLSSAYNVPAHDLTRDPAAVMNGAYYMGLLSNWGIMLWSATAGICLMAALLIREHAPRVGTWLFASGLLTLLLAVDDMFMLHETVFPDVFGIHEKLIYVLYSLVGGAYLLYFLPQILRRHYLFLILSVFFLGLMAVSDSIGRWVDIPTALEDSFKYIAIVFWLVFFTKSARDELTALLRKR
jgi:hypothetical protein